MVCTTAHKIFKQIFMLYKKRQLETGDTQYKCNRWTQQFGTFEAARSGANAAVPEF